MDKIVPARSRTDNLAADGFERTQKLVVGTNHSQPQGRAVLWSQPFASYGGGLVRAKRWQMS
jgi:hypothetical protein